MTAFLFPIGVVAFCPFWVQPTAGEALLVVDRRAIDFGTVARHATLERVLRVENRGRVPLELLGVDSNCSCLAGETRLGELAPGDSVDWRVSLTTCDYVGEVRRNVWLLTNGADRTGPKVTVRYRVVPEVFAEPELVALGLIDGEPVDAEISIETLSAEPIGLLGATSDSPYVTAILESDRTERGNPGVLRVHVHAPVPEGRFRPVVWVETDSAEAPRLRIPLFGESIRGIRCDRREIVFDTVPLGTKPTQTITFLWDADTRLGNVATSNESVETFSFLRERDRRKGVLTLRCDGKLPLGGFRGFLIVEVNGGRSRKVKVPYRGRVVEPAERSPPTAVPKKTAN